MAAQYRVYKLMTRHCLARIGIRGGVQYVEMQSGRLVVRRVPNEAALLKKGYDRTDLDPVETARKFLNHNGGTTNTSEVFLRACAYSPEVITDEQHHDSV